MSLCLTIVDFERVEAGLVDEVASRTFHLHIESCDSCRVSYERFRHDQSFLQGAKFALSDDSDSRQEEAGDSSPARKKKGGGTPDIEGYRIIGVLGHGGMGIVYRAVQIKLNRTVALKVLPAMVGAASPAAVVRFRREATAAARLHHTNIVPIYDFGESYDAYYYAMELISGRPLNQVIKELGEHHAATVSPSRLADLLYTITVEESVEADPHSGSSVSAPDPSGSKGLLQGGRGRAYYRQVAHWVADVADALHYAHDQGIIHRDIKPANLILSESGRIMVADFGLAKSADDESVTQTGSLLGTIRYLSPEQAMARRMPVDHRTDIYSLGATLYELLCFQPAFPGNDEKQVLSAIITREPTAPRKIASGVPAELETICLKTLDKQADARYPTARAFAEDLRRYTSDLPISAKPPSIVARSRKFVRRHKAGTIAVLSLLLASTAVPVALYYHKTSVRDQKISARDRLEKILSAAELETEAKNWVVAEMRFSQAMRMDPDSYEVLNNFASMLMERHNDARDPDPSWLKRALAMFEKCDTLKPTNWIVLNSKGVLHKQSGQYQQAINCYERAIKMASRENLTEEVWENLGIARALAHELEKAGQAFVEAGRIAAMRKESETIWCSLASLQIFKGSAEASTSLRRAQKRNRNHVWVALLSAKLQLSQSPLGGGASDVEEGLFDLEVAVELAGRENDNLGMFRRILALMYLRAGRTLKAADTAQLAIEAGDIDSMNQLIIAIARFREGDVEAGRLALIRASEKWPGDLTEPGSYRVSAEPPSFILWFDRFEDMSILRSEAEALLAAVQPK